MDWETFPRPEEREASTSTALCESCLPGLSHNGRPSHTALSSAESHAGAALVSLPAPCTVQGCVSQDSSCPGTVQLGQSVDLTEHRQEQMAQLTAQGANALSILFSAQATGRCQGTHHKVLNTDGRTPMRAHVDMSFPPIPSG